MTVHVRRHQRELASGKTSTVRAHERNAPGQGGFTVSASDEAWDRTSSHGASSGPSGTLERMKEDMRHWRSRGEPQTPPATPDTSPLGRALGTDTQAGADKFARLKAYRESGYDGPLNSENRIPDPDDPGEQQALEALAHMRWMEES